MTKIGKITQAYVIIQDLGVKLQDFSGILPILDGDNLLLENQK